MKVANIMNVKTNQNVQFIGRPCGISPFGYSNGERFNFKQTYTVKDNYPDSGCMKIEGKTWVVYKSDFKIV